MWYSLESPRWGDSNEYPQHTILWRNKQNYLLIITKSASTGGITLRSNFRITTVFFEVWKFCVFLHYTIPDRVWSMYDSFNNIISDGKPVLFVNVERHWVTRVLHFSVLPELGYLVLQVNNTCNFITLHHNTHSPTEQLALFLFSQKHFAIFRAFHQSTWNL